MLIQGGRLPVTNGVIAPINGLINGFAWGYNPYKWSYFTLLITWFLGLMLILSSAVHLGEGIVPSNNLPEKDEVNMCKNGCLLFSGLSRLQNRSIPPEIYPKNPCRYVLFGRDYTDGIGTQNIPKSIRRGRTDS